MKKKKTAVKKRISKAVRPRPKIDAIVLRDLEERIFRLESMERGLHRDLKHARHVVLALYEVAPKKMKVKLEAIAKMIVQTHNKLLGE